MVEEEFKTKVASNDELDQIEFLRKEIVKSFNDLIDRHRDKEGHITEAAFSEINYVIICTLSVLVIEFAERIGKQLPSFMEAFTKNVLNIGKIYKPQAKIVTEKELESEINKMMVNMKGGIKLH